MRIGLQLLCGLVLIFALAAWFVLEIFVEEIKPGCAAPPKIPW